MTKVLAARVRSEYQMPPPATTNISGIAHSLAKKAQRISSELGESRV